MTVSRTTSVIRHFKRDFRSSFEALGLVLVPVAFAVVVFSDIAFVVFHAQFGSVTFWLDLLEVAAAALYCLFFIGRVRSRFWTVLLSLNAINMFTFLFGLYLAVAPTNQVAMALTVARLAISFAIVVFVIRLWFKVRSQISKAGAHV